jgi:insulysin
MVGYNDKMRTLLETVIGKVTEFEVKPDRFFCDKGNCY